jgi:HD-GYP domain-containing protein (c-di-GMP phosphodiesterase class II)
VARLVRASHESYDGRGYPDGRKGRDIPLGARIIAVCDAFHAMRSDRPYSDGVDTAEAISELRRQAAVQFDPDVVEAFCASLADGRLRAGAEARLPRPVHESPETSSERERVGA